MGYYVDFVFEPEKDYDYRAIVKRLWDAGARIFPDDNKMSRLSGRLFFYHSKDGEKVPYEDAVFIDELESIIGIHDCETALNTFHLESKAIEMYHPDYPMPYMINVFKSEPENFKGNYADIRLSWATEYQEFIRIVGNMVELAYKIGCRIYDGQMEKYVTRENLEGIAEDFLRASGNIAGMFGVCKKPDESE